MSKVIDYNLEWFQEIAPRDFYNENDLERAISLSLGTVFPQFRTFPFKQKLINNSTLKKNAADLCMIKTDYSEWYVIEVELGEHSLDEVIKQIETFKNCTYSALHAKYIYEKDKSRLNLKRLTDLITSSPPQLMVIVNEQMIDWKKDLNKLNCKMCVFQVYNDYEGRIMYRLDGEHPFIFTDFCHCKYEKHMPYTVKVLKDDFLDGYNIPNGSYFWIEYKGISNLWLRQNDGSEVYLICNSNTSPLDPLSSRYRLNYNKLKSNKIRRNTFLKNICKFFNQNITPQNSSFFSFSKD